MEIFIKGHGRVPIYFLRVAFDFDELPFEQFVEEVPEMRRKSQKKKCGCDCLLLEVNRAKSLEWEGKDKTNPTPTEEVEANEQNHLSVGRIPPYLCFRRKAEEPE